MKRRIIAAWMCLALIMQTVSIQATEQIESTEAVAELENIEAVEETAQVYQASNGILKLVDGVWYYMANGQIDKSKHGYINYNGNLFLVANGRVASQISGLAQDPEKPQDWYYVSEGQVQSQYTGLAEYDGSWFYVKQGKLDTTMNAYVKYDTGLFLVASGQIKKEVNGLVEDPNAAGTWYYVAAGQVQSQYTGLAEYDGAWFYIKQGALDKSFEGFAEYNNSVFYVKNGQVISQELELGTVADLRTGSISNVTSTVNIRSGAGTEHSIVTRVSRGQIVYILENKVLENQKTWYRVALTKEGVRYHGWVIGDYLTIFETNIPDEPKPNPPETDDEKFVKSLLEAGFPQSYCDGLLKLHQKYPMWQFEPVLTGLDWNYVIENESVIGRNLVQNSVNDARKSTDSKAYDWKTDTWYGFDGANWVCASPSYIAYCMDPRNFFTESYIFQFETLEFEPYQNVSGISNLLKGTFMEKEYLDTDNQTKSYAESFYTIGSGLGVSPYHLASRCLQEQGVRGSSPLISGTYQGYEGYYNYFNMGAYTTSTASIIENGLAYAKRVGWDGIYKSLQGGSSIVADSYINKGQNTIYFEKFNVVNKNNLFSHQYMTNVMAAFSEGSKVSQAYEDKNTAFVFRIPVYENMPAQPVSLADNGNPNNWLSSLTVEGYGLTPTFTPEKTEYSLIVPSDVEEICIYATMVSSKASYSGAGFYSLKYGENTIQVTVTAQNGNVRTYTIDVVRQQPVAE